MSALLARNWWVVALRAWLQSSSADRLVRAGAVLLTLALLFAVYLLVDGVLGMVARRAPQAITSGGAAVARAW